MDKYLKIREERNFFPALKNSAYFETASTGLIPQYVYDAVKEYQDRRLYCGGDSVWGKDKLDSIEMMHAAKASLAKMINCSAEEMVFGGNTSEIMAHYIGNVRIAPGSNVVMAENTFSSGRYIWQMREKDGLKIRFVKEDNGKISPGALFQLADENTVAIHCDYVGSNTGFRIDAEKIGAFCREKKIRFILDGAQALGAIPVDVKKVQADLIAGNNYKWMMGYCGTGYGYISRDLWNDIDQKAAGWMSDQYRFYKDSPRLILRNDGGRFEFGYPDMPGIYGLFLTSEAYQRLGGELIEDYLMDLRHYLVKKIEETPGVSLYYQFDDKNCSQIVHVLLDGAYEVAYDSFREAGVMCNAYEDEKGTGLRIGLHYYNNEEDIDKLFAVISNAKK